MKKCVILGVVLMFFSAARAKDRDTSFIKRPYYLGITSGYSKFGTYAIYGTPFDMINLPKTSQSYEELYYDNSLGIELAFPFLRRWECETDFEFVQTFGWGQYCIYYEKNNPPPQEIIWHASSHDFVLNDWRLRSFFSYELMRKGKFSLNAGGGGWYSTLARIGTEAGLKCYYAVNRNISFQFGINAGYAAITKMYAAARFSVLLTGNRTYRTRPEHYYVRTYED